MADLIIWSKEYFEQPNPEVRLYGFPKGYNLIKTVPFRAQLKCPDFRILAKQVSYLMLIELGDMEETLIAFLKKNLNKPEFFINQSIEVYHKI